MCRVWLIGSVRFSSIGWVGQVGLSSCQVCQVSWSSMEVVLGCSLTFWDVLEFSGIFLDVLRCSDMF